MESKGVSRRQLLARGSKLAAAASAAPYLIAPGVAMAGECRGAGKLGLVGLDHVGLTVPDINEAVEWFESCRSLSGRSAIRPAPSCRICSMWTREP